MSGASGTSEVILGIALILGVITTICTLEPFWRLLLLRGRKRGGMGWGKVWNFAKDRGEVGSDRFRRHKLWKFGDDFFIFTSISKLLVYL
ncbi:hypothetical protein AGABI1DRAFT_81770 [Agaricus bisporus var. burnettii JB137-S8]|uniref:Uncharacterized protein n=1 Tax=Agaricus bisporus var. burnettii (strain JB137-S8 / ATCC MYA-4627 / FGSC 10392) TaxID=597362 RepID=K5XKX9_AGABU|nr:uncharacterized protein AGABI1DRAFT_81770 [Agaricus bisporus var. burnettii JB137-S8]EKM84047.1 hypothetical protein AGABI1DRAFT_81770 [Agaricus bisporus var. burnettii JB137-S8]